MAFIEGRASFERGAETEPAAVNVPFVIGDRLRTAASGRVEVIFSDGVVLDVDEDSQVDLVSPTGLTLVAGRLALTIPQAVDAVSTTPYRIDTPSGSIVTGGPGTFRATANRVPTGQAADDFDRFVAERRYQRQGAKSAQYLPPSLRIYGGGLDQYGAWQYVPPYGYGWYPIVTNGWRPYSDGHWSATRSYGRMWVGQEPWAWPTHHYGRWGLSDGSWFWIPDATWGPAWVSWSLANNSVSWRPLGRDNHSTRPVDDRPRPGLPRALPPSLPPVSAPVRIVAPPPSPVGIPAVPATGRTAVPAAPAGAPPVTPRGAPPATQPPPAAGAAAPRSVPAPQPPAPRTITAPPPAGAGISRR